MQDFVGKRIATVSLASLGGTLMQWREFSEGGQELLLDPQQVKSRIISIMIDRRSCNFIMIKKLLSVPCLKEKLTLHLFELTCPKVFQFMCVPPLS